MYIFLIAALCSVQRISGNFRDFPGFSGNHPAGVVSGMDSRIPEDFREFPGLALRGPLGVSEKQFLARNRRFD